MFNLEQKILEWRRQMQVAGVAHPKVLDELESHLREEVARQMQSGVKVEQAFAIATQSIGQPAALQDEFAKASSTKGTRLQHWKEALLAFLGWPRPFPSALTAGAWETLELGGKEALGFHHDFIGTEHVLLGLLEVKTGVVRTVLQRMGVDSMTVRSEIEKIVGQGPDHQTLRTPPFTPRVKKAMTLANAEARALRQTHVSPEHIFLGLLREGGGVAAIVLKSMGVNIQTARAEIFREIGRNQTGA